MLKAEHLSLLCLSPLWNTGLCWQAPSLLLRELLGSWIAHKLKLQLIQLFIFKEKCFFKRCKMQHLLFSLCQLSSATENSNNISLQWGQKVTLLWITYYGQTLQMSKHKPTKKVWVGNNKFTSQLDSLSHLSVSFYRLCMINPKSSEYFKQVIKMGLKEGKYQYHWPMITLHLGEAFQVTLACSKSQLQGFIQVMPMV